MNGTRKRPSFASAIAAALVLSVLGQAAHAQTTAPASVSDDSNEKFIPQDPRPFMTPTVPGVPSYPPGARYFWPGGLFYRSGPRCWRRPPIDPRYFDYHRIAPHTQCWP
jgi:hypothetical protein